MEIRKSSVAAMISAQYPWVELDDIEVVDNTDWIDDPHWFIRVYDDCKSKQFKVSIIAEDVK